MTESQEYDEKRDGWVTAVRIVKTHLDDDGADYGVITSPHVLDALAKLLITALRVNGALGAVTTDQQKEAAQRLRTANEEQIDNYVRGWLDNQIASIMLNDLGGAEP